MAQSSLELLVILLPQSQDGCWDDKYESPHQAFWGMIHLQQKKLEGTEGLARWKNKLA